MGEGNKERVNKERVKEVRYIIKELKSYVTDREKEQNKTEKREEAKRELKRSQKGNAKRTQRKFTIYRTQQRESERERKRVKEKVPESSFFSCRPGREGRRQGGHGCPTPDHNGEQVQRAVRVTTEAARA